MYDDIIKKLQRALADEERSLAIASDQYITEDRQILELNSFVRKTEKMAYLSRGLLPEKPERDRAEVSDAYRCDLVDFDLLPMGVLCITMPPLIMRKRTGTDSVKTFYDRMYRGSFESFFKSGRYQSPGTIVLWYRHCYPSLAGKSVPDHDNLETKIMTDMITRYLGVDDSPRHIETHVSSMESPPARTEIFVVPKDCFVRFYESVQKYAATF